jgi:hypothetical protein
MLVSLMAISACAVFSVGMSFGCLLFGKAIEDKTWPQSIVFGFCGIIMCVFSTMYCIWALKVVVDAHI